LNSNKFEKLFILPTTGSTIIPQKKSNTIYYVLGLLGFIIIVGIILMLFKKSPQTITTTTKPVTSTTTTTKPATSTTTTTKPATIATSKPTPKTSLAQTSEPNVTVAPESGDDIKLGAIYEDEVLITKLDGTTPTCPPMPELSAKDKCIGNVWKCKGETWELNKLSKCSDVYSRMNVSDANGWDKMCQDVVGDPSYNNSLKCTDISNNINIELTTKCTKVIPKNLKVTEAERCTGILDIKCVDNVWTKSKVQKCADVYKEYGTQDEWIKQCDNRLGDSEFINRITCTDLSGGINIASKKLCSKVINQNILDTITDYDRCNGMIDFKCTDNGWVKNVGKKCSDMYQKLKVYNMNEWIQKCDTMVGEQNNINKLTCKDTSDNLVITATAKCPKVVPQNQQLTNIEKCSGLMLECSDNGWIKVKSKTCDAIYKGIPSGINSTDWNNFCTDILGDTNYINKIKCTDISGSDAKVEVTQLCPKRPPSDSLTQSEICEGKGYVCNEKEKKWIKDYKFNSCDRLYGYIAGLESGSSANWMAQCKDKIGPDDSWNSDMRCVDTVDGNNNKAVKGSVLPGCKKTPPSGACNNGNCPIGQVCICDGSNNTWRCVSQKPGSKCVVPLAAMCIDSNGNKVTPQCIQCNTRSQAGGSTKELICPNLAPSSECLTSLYGISQSNAKDAVTNANVLYSTTAANDLPIYPLIDNTRCKENKQPFDDMTPKSGDNYIGHLAFNNPSGWLDTNYRNPKDDMIYHKPTTSFRKYKNRFGTECLWTDDEIATYLGDKGQSVCRGRGTFTQTKNSRSGVCTCNSGFAGSNCQYSDEINCKNRGTVSDSGTCTCKPGFAGSICQYSKEMCRNQGDPTNEGKCNCYEGYAGPNCEFSINLTCNNRGIPNNDGKCDCTKKTNVPDKTESTGPNCQFTNANTCRNRGTPRNNGTCICNTDNPLKPTGSNCQYDRNNCSGFGNPNEDNTKCTCDEGRTGDRCEKCDYKDPECDCNSGQQIIKTNSNKVGCPQQISLCPAMTPKCLQNTRWSYRDKPIFFGADGSLSYDNQVGTWRFDNLLGSLASLGNGVIFLNEVGIGPKPGRFGRRPIPPQPGWKPRQHGFFSFNAGTKSLSIILSANQDNTDSGRRIYNETISNRNNWSNATKI
jgi:hypothetical protein